MLYPARWWSDVAEDWASIAAEVGAAITDIGVAVTLEKRTLVGPVTPWDTTLETPWTAHTIYAVPDTERHRDATGILIGTTRDTLTVSAVGIVPAKGDRVLVRGTWRELEEVRVLWQGGVDLLYELSLVA